VLPETEAVNIVGAFERFFELSRGKEDELADQFSVALSPGEAILPSDSERVKRSVSPEKFLKRQSMREVWIRDFFQLRGDHAHGKIEPQKKTLWTLREHLLLASFAFPLVVKRALAEEGDYVMTPDDTADIAAFERLLEPDHFAERRQEDTSPYPWTRIRGEIRTRQWAEAYMSQQKGTAELSP